MAQLLTCPEAFECVIWWVFRNVSTIALQYYELVSRTGVLLCLSSGEYWIFSPLFKYYLSQKIITSTFFNQWLFKKKKRKHCCIFFTLDILRSSFGFLLF